MKISTLAATALVFTALAGGAALAQDAGAAAPSTPEAAPAAPDSMSGGSGAMAPGPAATMQPIPNPPGPAMSMGHAKKHYMHKKHAKAAAAAATPPAQ